VPSSRRSATQLRWCGRNSPAHERMSTASLDEMLRLSKFVEAC
jgi:hypothetical protein